MNIIARLFGKLFGVCFALAIVALLCCFAKFLYFHEKKPISREITDDIEFSQGLENPRESGHYHILPAEAYTNKQRNSLCLQCHGNYCHYKSEKLRSFYNMHSFYLACETCHVRPSAGESFEFHWYDDHIDKKIDRVTGSLGNYGARIVPVSDGERLDRFPRPELAREYMENEHTYSEEKKKRMQKELMEHVSPEAVVCCDCHKQNGYIDFESLGYPAQRAGELMRLEVVKMVQEYEDEFYLPKMFEPER
jgi:hypothetical protein